MVSVLDIETEDLIRGFNFISRVFAAELGEAEISPTDRITASAQNIMTETLWERMCARRTKDDLKDLLDRSYRRCYRFTCKKSKLGESLFDFRIYVANFTIEESDRVISYGIPLFTTDQDNVVLVVIPNMSCKQVDNDRLFKVIRSVFTRLLYNCRGYSKEEHVYFKSFLELVIKFFALLTGLFPESFDPKLEHYMEAEKLYQDIMNNSRNNPEGGFMSVSRTGYMMMNNDPNTLIQYLVQLAELI